MIENNMTILYTTTYIWKDGIWMVMHRK